MGAKRPECLGYSLAICLYPINVQTDRAQIFCGTSNDLREVKVKRKNYLQNRGCEAPKMFNFSILLFMPMDEILVVV